jgi:hypothetical protein
MSNWEWLAIILCLYLLGVAAMMILINAHLNDWEGWRQVNHEEEVARIVQSIKDSTPEENHDLIIAKLNMAMGLPGMEELRPLINEEINILLDQRK